MLFLLVCISASFSPICWLDLEELSIASEKKNDQWHPPHEVLHSLSVSAMKTDGGDVFDALISKTWPTAAATAYIARETDREIETDRACLFHSSHFGKICTSTLVDLVALLCT